MGKENPLLAELHKLYGEQPVERDVFGRRQATPAEVEQTIHRGTTFPELEPLYPPNQQDVNLKEERIRRRRTNRKPR